MGITFFSKITNVPLDYTLALDASYSSGEVRSSFTYRLVLPPSSLSTSGGGQGVKFYCTPHASSMTITKAYVGKQASSGNVYDFASTPTQIFFDSGNASKTSSAGITSDETLFSWSGTDTIILSVYCGPESYFKQGSGGLPGGASSHYFGSDQAADLTPTIYQSLGNTTKLITDVYVGQPA